MAIASQRHAEHSPRHAHGVGMRAENCRVVDSPADRTGDDARRDSEGLPLADSMPLLTVDPYHTALPTSFLVGRPAGIWARLVGGYIEPWRLGFATACSAIFTCNTSVFA